MTGKADEIIMECVKEGDLAEMSVLFERYHLRLFNYFLKLGLNRENSQDLTQNLFYRMIKYKNTYQSGFTVKSWMYQMARNLHADYRKQQKRSEQRFLKIESYSPDVADSVDGYREEDFARLEEAFSGLKDEQKEIIILSRYQGMKYEEIAEITSQSVPAIKVAMHRAIKQLRGIYFKQT